MALALIGFSCYIAYFRFVKKRQNSEWGPTTVSTIFLWALLALATDFLFQMAIQDRIAFHLACIPIVVIGWLVVRFYYRVKVF